MTERKRDFNEEVLMLGIEADKYQNLFSTLLYLFPEWSDCNYVAGIVTTYIDKDNPTKGEVDVAVRVGRLSVSTGRETCLVVELGVNLGPDNFNPIKKINLATPSSVTKRAMLQVNRNSTLNTIIDVIRMSDRNSFIPVP